MNPIKFKGMQTSLGRPDGTTEEQSGPLPIVHLNREAMGTTCVSCWRMSWRERLKALVTGRVWVEVWSGATQPPISIGADKPFRTK